jgi:hypothetical protein
MYGCPTSPTQPLRGFDPMKLPVGKGEMTAPKVFHKLNEAHGDKNAGVEEPRMETLDLLLRRIAGRPRKYADSIWHKA